MTGSVSGSRLATLLIFLVCGIGVATWAPIVPLATRRIGLSEAELGLTLLSMGTGAILAMPFMGPVIQKLGSRLVILGGSIITALILPVLTLADTVVELGIALFIFGASVGSLDVAMNAQAVVVQDRMARPVMSSFHAMFSVGGLIGSVGLGLLMMTGLSPTVSAALIGLMLLLIATTQYRSFLDHPNQDGAGKFSFRLPKGPVILLGVFCFFSFLVEGAMLDWSALFLRQEKNFSLSMAGWGYGIFSVAMALMRLTGDRLVRRFGPGKMVGWGALLAAAGILGAVLIPYNAAAIFGFLLIGVGAANIVPVMFSAAGAADKSSPEQGLAAVTTLGYAGQLAGPALIGFAAELTSLPLALALLSVPLLVIALTFGSSKAGKLSISEPRPAA